MRSGKWDSREYNTARGGTTTKKEKNASKERRRDVVTNDEYITERRTR